MAWAEFIRSFAPFASWGLVWAGVVFLLWTFGAWGLGDAIVGAFRLDQAKESRLQRPLLSLAVGFGVAGQALFLAGLVGEAYQEVVVGPALAVLAVFAVSRIRRPQRDRWWAPPRDLGILGWAVVGIATLYLCRWGWISMGFNVGSDVITHHYPFVKFIVREQHFAHRMHLPFGMDMFSSYNPGLARMLWLPGHLLADERAANLFHWLTQGMLIVGLYTIGRSLVSRRAGLLAVAAYLTVGLLGNHPLEAQDYTLTAVYLILATGLILVGLRDDCRRAIVLAGVLAGLMLSTKYYAVPLVGLLALATVWGDGGGWRTSVRTALVFGGCALLVGLPWYLYNFVSFGDPFFPSMLQNEELRHFRAVSWVHILTPFVVASDRNFWEPTLFYYLSMFVPYEPGNAMFGLSVMFLIGLPASVYCWFLARGPVWRSVNVLFALAVLSFAALHLTVGHSAFYKWALFPAVLYAASFGMLVEQLPRRWALVWWSATVVAVGLNYWCIAGPRMGVYAPPAGDQRVRWSEIDTYLNTHMEQGATISGTDNGFYLRPDLTGLPESTRVSTNWADELALIQRVGVNYMIVNPTEDAVDSGLTERWTGIWRQLSPDDSTVAEYLESVDRRRRERNRDKANFIEKRATLVHEFSNGLQLYRVMARQP